MGLQIIFVLETDEKSRSDYMYISSILDQWYDFRQNNDIKISKVFMRGKGNFRKKNIVNKIESFIKAYNNGDSYVVYCFDTDHFERNQTDLATLQEEQNYCKKNGYKLVWFCHDIEEVFLGKSVANNEKTEQARKYVANNGIVKLKRNQFESKKMTLGKSNLVLVLNDLLQKT